MKNRRAKLLLVALLSIAGCSGLPKDLSMPAVEAGDYTLATSACLAAPGGGMDVCMVVEGTEISSEWVLIVPAKFSSVLSGEVNVFMRDIQRSYPANEKVIRIPWKDFFASSKWDTSMDGEALALVSIRYKDAQGIEETALFRGIAKLVVTKQGYARMPIDSGVAAWQTSCKIQYSTAGRSAISCQ